MHSNTDLLSTTNIATQMWYDEVTDPGYDFNNQGFTSGTGHFTQVVWKGSTELGCGVAGVYVVCRYCNGPGNFMSQFEDNVFPKGDQNADCNFADNTDGSTLIPPVSVPDVPSSVPSSVPKSIPEPVLGPEYDDPLNIPEPGKTFMVRNVKFLDYRLAYNGETFFFDGSVYDDQFWTLETCTHEFNLQHMAAGLASCLGTYWLRNDRYRNFRMAHNPKYGVYAWGEGPYYDQLWRLERYADG